MKLDSDNYSRSSGYHRIKRSFRKKVNQLFGKSVFVKQVGNTRLLLDNNNLVDRHIDTYGSFEPEQLNYLSEQIGKQGSTIFIDIGAHWGLYTLYLASMKPSTLNRFIAFEPDKKNINQFYANLFLNDDVNVELWCKALSDSSGTAKFKRHKSSNRGASRLSDDGDAVVEVVPGDKILDIEHENIVIKIDVEGHELEVLRGLQKLLANNRCLLQIEVLGSDIGKVQSVLGNSYQHIHSIEKDHYFLQKQAGS